MLNDMLNKRKNLMIFLTENNLRGDILDQGGYN